jgi:Tetrapyrrole (Corrin/Porphyrin) Methylases
MSVSVETTTRAPAHESELLAVAAAAAELSKALGTEPSRPGGSLTVVGTGIRAIAQLTVETLAAMSEAEALLHVIGEPVQEEALATINPLAETLTGYYIDGMERASTYEAIINRVLGEVMAGKRTVAAFYGHPGVFTYPSHESVRRARAAGLPARMLPAVSSEDCLFADLGIDPGDGCQSYEATDFIFRDRPFTPTAHLVLWQVGTLGNWTYESSGYDLSSFPALVQKLLRAYPPAHPVTIYEAPFHPTGEARTNRLPIAQLHGSQMTPATTLHISPLPVRSPWRW